jgi:dTDP-4-dehydrorhamnose reductase
VEWAIDKLENGEKIGGFCDVFFNPLYVSQLSEVIIKLIELEIKGVINIASDSKLSKYDFLLEIAEVFGFDKKLIEKKSIKEIDFTAKRPENTTLNTDMLNEIIGYTPSFKFGVINLYRDYLNEF